MMKFEIAGFESVLASVAIGSSAVKLNLFGKSMRQTSTKGDIVYGSVEAYNPVQNIQVSQHFSLNNVEDITEDISAYLDYKKLYAAVKALCKIDDTLLVTIDEKEISLSAGKAACLTLQQIEPVDVVVISNETPPILKAVVDTHELLEGIKNGAYSYSSHIPSAKGVFIRVQESAFEIVSMDSTSMAQSIVAAQIDCQDDSLSSIYVASSINYLKSLLEEKFNTSIALVQNYLLVQNGMTFVLIGLLSEKFPENICGLFNIIDDATVKFTLNKKELLNAIDVVTFDEAGKGKITFNKKGKNSFVIYSASNNKNKVSINSSVEDFESFSLSAAVLRETLDHIAEETVMIRLIEPKKPLFIKGLKDGKEVKETHLVTPVTNQK